jgi:hypothetical protein
VTEKDYYEPIKKGFEELFNAKGETHLEITANKNFSNRLKGQIGTNRDIIFYFLKEVAPDISGFIMRDYGARFIVIEVKDEVLKLDHIYQTRKYAELFDASFAFLVSTHEIPEEIKKLSKVVYSLLSLPVYKSLILVHVDKKTHRFVEWFEENPFENEYYWR